MVRLTRLFVAALAVAALAVPGAIATAAEGAQTGLGIQLLDAPTALKADPRAHVYIIDHLAPGAVIQRKVQVTDGTDAPLTVLLYAAGSQIKAGSWLPFDGQTPDELSRWNTVSPSVVHLQPGASAIAQVTIRVPRDAVSGERYAVVWAQAQMPSTGPVAEVARVGIREYLSVGSGAAPATNFTIDTLTAARTPDGHPEVLAQVHNVGGRAIDLTGKLRLTKGPGGLTAGPFPAKLGTTLAPGQSEPVTVVLDKALPAGPWQARITLQSDLIRRAATGTITFPLEAGTAAKPVRAKPVPLTKNRHVLVPVAVGLIVLLLIGLLLFLLWRRRRRDDEEEGTRGRGGPPTVPAQRKPARERDRQRQ